MWMHIVSFLLFACMLCFFLSCRSLDRARLLINGTVPFVYAQVMSSTICSLTKSLSTGWILAKDPFHFMSDSFMPIQVARTGKLEMTLVALMRLLSDMFAFFHAFWTGYVWVVILSGFVSRSISDYVWNGSAERLERVPIRFPGFRRRWPCFVNVLQNLGVLPVDVVVVVVNTIENGWRWGRGYCWRWTKGVRILEAHL